jgi:phospholipid/cholesterol/gamma-HCH transport system substrate-binding protein
MASRQSLSWVELRVGILVIASFTLLGAGIFYVGGQAGFLTETYSITAYFESASGMTRGADVWLDGVPVGSVSSVTVSPSADPMQSVEIGMDIDADYQEMIRSDSILTIGTVGLLGDGYVDIARGYTGDVLQDGDTIQGESPGGLREIIEGTDDIVANIGELSSQIEEITQRVRDGEGTLGQLLTDSAVYDNLASTTAEANLLVRDVRMGSGTIGLLMSDDQLYNDLRGTLGRVDNMVSRAEAGEGTIGRLLTDDALFEQLSEVLEDFSIFTERLEQGEGTLGRLSNDDTLYLNASTAMENITDMVESVANSEGTAGRLINDPALYDNMNTTISEFLKLVYDFRQEPERFLTINFRLF